MTTAYGGGTAEGTLCQRRRKLNQPASAAPPDIPSPHPLVQPSMMQLLIAALLLAPALTAQTILPPTYTYDPIRTPEIQLGSGSVPTTITVHPVVELPSVPSEPQVSNAQPANTALLATRHFDFIVSPVAGLSSPPGNLADTSISLGEYARQLRAQKRAATQSAPDSMAQPTDSR